MALPNFLIIGAQKSGTTWLGDHLRRHPQVFMVMGTYYFDNPANLAKGLGWYQNFYRKVKGEIAICDKTPSYLWGEKFSGIGDPENVPKRVREVLPSAKIIAILRNPVKRAVSSFHHIIRSGKVSPFVDIDEALTGDPRGKIRGLGILERGLYFRQLERWLRHFSPHNVRVLIFERDIVKTPTETLLSISKFLGIDPSFDFENVHEKVHPKLPKAELVLKYYAPRVRKALKPLMKFLPQNEIVARPETYAYLANYYAEENAKLAKYLGLDVSWWGDATITSKFTATRAVA